MSYFPLVYEVLKGAIIAVATIVLAWALRTISFKILNKHIPTWSFLASNIIFYIFLILGFYLIVLVTPLDNNVFLAFLGILTAGFALTIGDSLNNLLAGIKVTSSKLYIVDDYVQIDGYIGWVDAITTNHTFIRTRDNETVILNNKRILENTIVNFTRNGSYCVAFLIPFAGFYNRVDAQYQLERITREFQQKHGDIVLNIQIRFDGVQSNAEMWKIKVQINNPHFESLIKSNLKLALVGQLSEQNFEVGEVSNITILE